MRHGKLKAPLTSVPLATVFGLDGDLTGEDGMPLRTFKLEMAVSLGNRSPAIWPKNVAGLQRWPW